MRRTLAIVLSTAMMLLAGCGSAGNKTSTSAATTAAESADAGTTAAETAEAGASVAEITETGTVNADSASESSNKAGEIGTETSASDNAASENSTGNTVGETSASVETSAAVTYPVTVTDQIGREVVIEKEPETLVSGYYISTSLLIALGLKDKLVGIEAKAKSRSIYRLSAPEVIDLPSVGTAKEFDLEGCAALEPDLIVLPAKLKDVIPSLEELGMTAIAVNPEDKALLEEAVTLLGTATNTADRANELLAFHDKQLAPLSEALSDIDAASAPTVYLASNSSLLAVAGPAMYQNSLIEQAAGANAAAEITDDYWADISYEQLLAWNPDYIILAADAEYSVDSVLEDENLKGLKAVTNGNVYQFPNAIESWDSPVPSSILGSMWLASVIHPDQYPADGWKQAAAEYYETFYGFTPDMENLYSAAE